jgi:hypothetical protein
VWDEHGGVLTGRKENRISVGTLRQPTGHVRQIAELVRARKYLAGAGPLGEDYQLKP